MIVYIERREWNTINMNNTYFMIRERIKQLVDRGEEKFIIFPYGEEGMLTKKILNECFGIEECFIVDNGLAQYNPKIKDFNFLSNYLKNVTSENVYVLFASFNNNLKKLLEDKCYNIISLLQYNNNLEVSNNENKIGRYSYGPLAIPNFKIESVGAFCSFAEGVDVVWNHQLDMVTNHDFIYESVICSEITNQKYKYSDFNKKYIIGHDVWLGKNVILTNGVHIGNGVRAAAGAIITKDVPDYAVVAGIPARIIKYRFTPEQIKKLNKIAWWNWPIEKIRDCYDDFIDIDIFLEKHYRE